jgi:hypothetical protein
MNTDKTRAPQQEPKTTTQHDAANTSKATNGLSEEALAKISGGCRKAGGTQME